MAEEEKLSDQYNVVTRHTLNEYGLQWSAHLLNTLAEPHFLFHNSLHFIPQVKTNYGDQNAAPYTVFIWFSLTNDYWFQNPHAYHCR